MNADQIIVKFQIERYEIFKAQNPEDDEFDVVFDFNGKKLYANKFILYPISTTFKSMLSHRWTTPNEAIIIKNYSFDDFKEFLTFIYSGQCELTEDNIFTMVDIAEFYDIKVFKDYCEGFLMEMEMNLENIYQMIENACKYSMDELKKCAEKFICENLSNIFKSEQLQKLDKSLLKFILESCQQTMQQEEIFDAVYKWAEIRANKARKLDKALDKKKAIKKELYDFLALIKFERMTVDFFVKLIHKKYFLFSDQQLDEILQARKKVYVKITDENGKRMKGELQCDDIEKVVEVIQAQRNNYATRTYSGSPHYYWSTEQEKPPMPCKMLKKEETKWYLIYDHDGDLAVQHRSHLEANDYLLAEMTAENGFQLSDECKIEVYRFD